MYTAAFLLLVQDEPSVATPWLTPLLLMDYKTFNPRFREFRAPSVTFEANSMNELTAGWPLPPSYVPLTATVSGLTLRSPTRARNLCVL
jgi:hypothetical protein